MVLLGKKQGALISALTRLCKAGIKIDVVDDIYTFGLATNPKNLVSQHPFQVQTDLPLGFEVQSQNFTEEAMDKAMQDAANENPLKCLWKAQNHRTGDSTWSSPMHTWAS